WALAFWICAACSLSSAVSVSICCCCCVMVACRLSTVRSSIACLAASGMAWGWIPPLGENPPGSGPSEVTVRNLTSESTITGAAGGIVHERKVTGGSVGGTAVVKDQRISSNGGVLCAGGVEQERCRAHCSIGICIVEDQRSTADSGVETAGGIRKERTPTEPCISSASSKKTKRVAPFRRREVGVA